MVCDGCQNAQINNHDTCCLGTCRPTAGRVGTPALTQQAKLRIDDMDTDAKEKYMKPNKYSILYNAD